ncbi:hypothetical protein [Butyrivibrio sp.]|uniref:hypothetical protein n=1 Tax=Butyrivibrio sp. TaxID=28121 RepID=UPI0025C65B79|nr:hypothetical protein [Butyrivibrio sp.]MBE5837783.1 hypothetical protein [Butyrivibrio sp.]
MKNNRNGEGSVRKLKNGRYECIIQSKYPDPALCPYNGREKEGKRNLTLFLLSFNVQYCDHNT